MADQQQLFDPGPRGPNRWALHPDKWVKRSDVVYHASDSSFLPRKDRGPNIDPGYGNSSGMHFGDKDTAFERSRTALGSLDYIHTARLNGQQFLPKDSEAAKSLMRKVPGAEVRSVWTDEQANYTHEPDVAVRAGKVVPYRNEFENPGAISFRALPEVTKTWSEDVKDSPTAHPALKHLADKGYNPTMGKYENYSPMAERDLSLNGPLQKQLFAGDVVKGNRAVAHHVKVEDAIAESGERKWVSGESNVHFTRNNMVEQPRGSIELQRKAVPRLRPTRPVSYD